MEFFNALCDRRPECCTGSAEGLVGFPNADDFDGMDAFGPR